MQPVSACNYRLSFIALRASSALSPPVSIKMQKLLLPTLLYIQKIINIRFAVALPHSALHRELAQERHL